MQRHSTKLNEQVAYAQAQQDGSAYTPTHIRTELAAQAELIPTLETLKAAVSAGELDAQIEVMSGTLRKGFAKKSLGQPSSGWALQTLTLL